MSDRRDRHYRRSRSRERYSSSRRRDYDRDGTERSARLQGTEQDRVNCPFYFKMGACRHGEKCERQHVPAAFSQTVLIPHMYQNPLARKAMNGEGGEENQRLESQERDPNFEEFLIDVFEEVSNYGEIEDIVVCNNLCDHLLGNVYIKFYDEQDAEKCVNSLRGRYYAGIRLEPIFTQGSDFSQARCRMYDSERCDRGGNCNYMHIMKIDSHLKRALRRDQPYDGHRSGSTHHRSSRRRSYSRSPSRSYSRRSPRHRDSRSRRSRRSRSLSSEESYRKSRRSKERRNHGHRRSRERESTTDKMDPYSSRERKRQERSKSRSSSRSSGEERRKERRSKERSPKRQKHEQEDLPAEGKVDHSEKANDVVDSMLGPLSR